MSPAAVLVGALVLGGALAGRPPGRSRRPAGRPAWVAPPAPRGARPPTRRRGAAAGEAAALGTLPELVDLLAVAVAAGLPAAAALLALADRAPAPWAPALRDVRLAIAGGQRISDGLEQLVRHHGDLARPLVGALRAALDDGDALAPSLARLAVDARDLRRRRAEEAARRLPVRLLLPLVCCSLPAFAVLTVVPILAGALTGLRLPS